ncbi:NAD-dependent epimerase/dehydratase family protein [Rhodococcus fascians]|uniref:NAD-dependent epimerase/dehydratase family protein n=1 Tax=Rhodococcoides fascians TaxID=1828 RepID=UPI00195C7C46|nr:NAD-dependent epimerase/dehydratase family protein [Rhodococcus fascians]MBM7241605.1 NAD-dependent epimerase/dehydratase family protein [Rhodococcus fascians]MBY3808310.1 NAD-dependent epimerase/dehydratase family protein [Rhodococcus fascians]MBY3839754.1 NAD-dependent epimerase/dehydratase family protein [Rhodococcus fascians]MBY3846617.1 NAD-dependent epimerase/dehydratase family protein [Rhodococcus fascians]MBY3849045.1 NAD-dependent epimerase/dehydratase family protein [Rhodococcus f
MRIVVVGATGNVGTALLRTLVRDRPGDSILAIARRPPDLNPYAEQVDWVPLDLTSDSASYELRALFQGADAVVHLAIAFQPMRDREYLRAVNVDAVKTVSRVCAEAKVPHLVHMSSGGVYAPGSYGVEVDESWPRTGVPSSTYSMDKAAAEIVLDEIEDAHADVAVARIRPGLIGQYKFGSALLRYALPDVVPSGMVDHLPILPIDRSFAVPAIHSDDVADALVRVLDRRATGPYNLGGTTPVRADDVAEAFESRILPVPHRVLSVAARVGFDTRLSAVHHGWVDLAFATPMLNTDRARRDLDWTPRLDGPDVAREIIRGMRDNVGASTTSLRSRTAKDRLRAFGRRGFISSAKRP